MVWLDADLQWQAPASGRSGRPAVLSDAAIQFCLTLKCMFGLGLRQATGLTELRVRVRVSILNRFSSLGTPETVRVA
jgi:hypothetical protein